MERLKELVNELNDNIQHGDLVGIDECVCALRDEGYIDDFESDCLMGDIINDGCTFPLSSFIEEE